MGDAICIIQDDDEDKAREIGAMASIYRSSTVTILAAVSKSVRDGYLSYSRQQPPFLHFLWSYQMTKQARPGLFSQAIGPTVIGTRSPQASADGRFKSTF